MSDSTLTRYLKLKIAADLSADAKYNLNRIDSLGFLATVNDDDSLNVVARAGIKIEPNSADVGGTGQNGTVTFGTENHTLTSVTAYVSEFLVKAGFKLANQAPTATNSLQLDFSSAGDLATDRVLTVDVGSDDRTLTIDESGHVTVTDSSGVNTSIKSLTGLTTPLSVNQGGTGRVGPTNDAHALDELVPVYTAAERGFALAVDDNDEANGLIWKEFEAGGTVTSVGLDVSAVPELTLTATSNPIDISGTFTLSKSVQQAAKVYAGPVSGPDAVPTFRPLDKIDLPALTTDDVSEGSRQYFTNVKAQNAVVVQTLVAGDLTHAPSSDRMLTLLSGKEPTISGGTTAQYWRGDKSFQSISLADVSGLSAALSAKYDASNPASYVDATGAKTAAVVNSTSGSEIDQAPSVSAMKSYVSSATAGGTYSTSWTSVVGIAQKTVNHNLNSSAVIVSVYDSADGKQVTVDDIDIDDANNVTLTAYQYDTGLPKTWTVVVQK